MADTDFPVARSSALWFRRPRPNCKEEEGYSFLIQRLMLWRVSRRIYRKKNVTRYCEFQLKSGGNRAYNLFYLWTATDSFEEGFIFPYDRRSWPAVIRQRIFRSRIDEEPTFSPASSPSSEKGRMWSVSILFHAECNIE